MRARIHTQALTYFAASFIRFAACSTKKNEAPFIHKIFAFTLFERNYIITQTQTLALTCTHAHTAIEYTQNIILKRSLFVYLCMLVVCE